jgi:hypothetical protein
MVVPGSHATCLFRFIKPSFARNKRFARIGYFPLGGGN